MPERSPILPANRNAGTFTAAAALLLTFIVAAANLSWSWRFGRLAAAWGYDDVTYLLDGAQRYAAQLPAYSLWGFIADPPHSPANTLLAMAGYTLFGFSGFSAYLMNSLVVGAYLFFGMWATRGLHVVARVSLLVILAWVPVAHAMITEFRPDIMAGVVLGICVVLLTTTDWLHASLARKVGLGVMLALAVVVKPPGIAVVMPVIGAAAAVSIFFQSSRKDLVANIGRSLPTAISAGAILVPFLLIWGPSVYAYLFQMFVTNADVWKSNGGFAFHALFHSVGDGGRAAFGGLVPLFAGLAAIAADAALGWKDKGRGRTALYVVISIIYFGLSVSREKSVMHGSYFYVPFLFASVIAARSLLMRASGSLGRWVSLAPVIAATLAVAFLPIAGGYTVSAGLGSRGTLRTITDTVLARITAWKRQCSLPRAPVFAAAYPRPMAPQTVALDLAYSGETLNFLQLFFERSADTTIAGAKSADFVLVDSTAEPVGYDMPVTPFLGALTDALRADQDFDAVELAEAGGGKSTLFSRVACPS